MTFAAPWGLLALLALPAVVALHLYRNRLPEQRVAGLFLFPATAAVSEGGRVRTRLVRSPSLWLECLAALLAALWLAGLTFGALRPRHVVVALDDSASMSAEGTRARALPFRGPPGREILRIRRVRQFLRIEFHDVRQIPQSWQSSLKTALSIIAP